MTRLRWWRPEIVCQQWVEMVTDYLEGALPPKLQQAADRHLADCPHCREYLEQMRLTIRVATRLGDVPDDVIEALTRAFADYRDEGGS